MKCFPIFGLLLSCASRATLDVPPPADCPYYACRGCTRAPDYDFACHGHELLTSAYQCDGPEPDLCKANGYGTKCCFPDPGEP